MKLKDLLQQLEDVRKKIGVSPYYICGGTPRDKYLGNLKNISDLDITTGDKTAQYLSEEFANVLSKNFNIKRRVMDDGHSTIIIGNLSVDFSSNFITANIDAILKEEGISQPSGLQKEMFSRDFTCNALLLTPDFKNIIDLTKKGLSDLNSRRIRTCLAPEITLTAYRNRVARAIYLACKLDFDIDHSIVDFVRKNPSSFSISTYKSSSEKINNAFTADPDKASHYVTRMGLWELIPITRTTYPYYSKYSKGKRNAT